MRCLQPARLCPQSLELLKFGYRLLILALITFLAFASALAILALALALRLPYPVLARRET